MGLNWHQVFESFGACAWLYAPIPPNAMTERKQKPGDDGWDRILKHIRKKRNTPK